MYWADRFPRPFLRELKSTNPNPAMEKQALTALLAAVG